MRDISIRVLGAYLHRAARSHLGLVLPTILAISLAAAHASAASGGAYGHVYAYREDSYAAGVPGHGPAVPNRPVMMIYCSQATLGVCTRFDVASATTDQNGYFQTAGWVTGATSAAFLVTSGSEVAIPSISLNGWAYADITRAPHMISPNGGVWLRKFGSGDYPLFVFEGFDANDSIKTGMEVPSPSLQPGLLGLFDDIPLNQSTTAYGTVPKTNPKDMNNQTIAPGQFVSMLEFIKANNYALYMITSGSAWSNSLAGTGDHSDGQAFQAMKLAWQARQRYAPTRKMVLGGFSLGGALVQAGMVHWCNGDFFAQIGPEWDLRSGCDEVAMWWAADAALDGANVPEALQRFIKDTHNNVAKAVSFRTALNSDAGRELMNTWVNDGCNTNCWSGSNAQSCDSNNASYSGGCTIDNSRRQAFKSWSGTGPTRGVGGPVVPAVAFSLGQSPNDTGGGIKQDCAANANEFMRVHVDVTKDYVWGLFTSSSSIDMVQRGKPADCSHGSRLTPLVLLNNTPVTDGLEGLGWALLTGGLFYGSADGHVKVKFLPTYIPTSSSLLWPQGNSFPWTGWKEWRTATTDSNHDVAAFPVASAGMTMAWISEYAKGWGYAPVQSATKTSVGSRPPSTELFNGQDDDGDEKVDEVLPYELNGLTASWTDQSNQVLTVVSKERYWNIRRSDGAFLDSGYLEEGWKLNGALRFSPRSDWFDYVPPIDGVFPWQVDGVTAAYNTNDQSKLVILSANRMWIYDWASYSFQTRHVDPSETGWTGIVPNFSTAPLAAGETPWMNGGINGLWHAPGDRSITFYRGTRFWTWDFTSNIWSAVGTAADGSGAHWYDGRHISVRWSGAYSAFDMAGNLLSTGQLQNDAFWQNAPQVVPGIVVQSATYGGNCGAASGNQTPNLWANCTGKQVCLYTVDYTQIGDPAPGCGKDYVASYYCPGLNEYRSVTLPPEATGTVAVLSCP